jgi:hypothetical protein
MLLATLLMLTTPVGAGQGVHANMLLDSVLPHVHLLDGRVVTDAQLTAVLLAASRDNLRQPPVSGPALGAGGAAEAASLGTALVPTVPEQAATIIMREFGRLSTNDAVRPDEFRELPQDPPPDRRT